MALAPGEWKKIAGIVGVCAIASIFAKRRQKFLDEKEVEEHGVISRERSFMEHPFIAYLIENTSIIGLVTLALKVPVGPGSEDINRFQLTSLARLYLRSFVLIEAGLAIQEFILAPVLYSNIPYFSEKRPSLTSWDQFTDWLQCNFPAVMVNTMVEFLALQMEPKDVWDDVCFASARKPLYVFPFLAKLTLSRFVADIAFHVAHRWMHKRDVYKQLHSRHHEHNKCVIATNFHFTWMDIFLEAGVPIWAGLGVMKALKIDVNATELFLIFTYIVWFEGASHTGKEIPYATMFPPLAPLINALFDVDRDNIKYHETHHNLVRCNYGITQWVDKLAGTHRLQRQPCELGVKEIAVKEIPDEEDEAEKNALKVE